MRKIVYQAKKSLSAILAAAMLLTMAPVNVMAEDVLQEGTGFAGNVGGMCSFNPGGGSFDPASLTRTFVGLDNNTVHGEVNAYSAYEAISENEIVKGEGELKEGLDLSAPIYYRYFKNESNGKCAICVNNWKNIIPVKEGYIFTGWYLDTGFGAPNYANPLLYNELDESECYDRNYIAGWKEARYLPNIKSTDVKVQKLDNRIVKTTLKIDQSIFQHFDPLTEDLYVMRKFGSEMPNDKYNSGSPDETGWYWQWTRWGDGSWDRPIMPGVEEIELFAEFYNKPVNEEIDVAVTLQYFTCEKGAGGLSSPDMNQKAVKSCSNSAYRASTKLMPKADFSAALTNRFFEYTGKDIKPAVTVRNGSIALKENIDYAVAYEDNLDAGTGMAIVSGKGAYEDVITKLAFFIKKKSLDTAKNIKVVFSKAGTKGIVTVYNGKEIIPGNQYVASIKDNDINNIKDATSYEVVITFNDDSKILRNYVLDGDSSKKQVSKVFQKAEKDFRSAFTVSVSANNIVYTGKAIKPAVTVIDNETKEPALTKYYTVAYKDNIKAGIATVTVKGKGGYVGSVEETFEIKKKDTITDITVADVVDAVYSGKAYTPKPKVTAKVDGRLVTLKNGKDYSLSYFGNVNVGKGYVYVNFDNYNASRVTKEYNITQATINYVKPSGNYYPKVKYTTNNSPLVVKAGKATLTKDDYDVVTQIKDDGKIYITVKAKGNNVKNSADEGITVSKKLTKENLKTMNDTYKRVVYYGETYSLSGNYLVSTVDKARLTRNDATVTGDLSNGEYLDITTLQIGKTATIKWSVSSNDARYTGSKTVKIQYAAKNIVDENVGLAKYEISSNAIPAQTYTGQAVTISNDVLKNSLKNSPANSKYDIEEILKTARITYLNNKNKSTESKPAYVIIQGKGNFTGRVKIPFIIK